jgi:O-antigen ligase
LLSIVVKRDLAYCRWRILGFLIFCCVLIFIFFAIGPEKILFRYAQLEAIEQASSWQARQTMWDANLELWQQSYLLGWGPAKASMDVTVDNEWLLLLRRYGIVGLLVFLFFIAFVGLSHIRKINSDALCSHFQLLCKQHYALCHLHDTPPLYICHAAYAILLLFLGLAYSNGDEPNNLSGEILT